jgi:NAD(P)H-hydrate epimerase
MRPVLTAAEMAEVDARAQAEVGIEELIGRAGHAVFSAALARLGGAYGRRVVVVAGRGHNGDDGRVAAALLARRGVRVQVIAAGDAGESLPECDLVIDGAYGTGFRGQYRAPRTGAEVLAVDVPSGVRADTGAAEDGAVVAQETVTFGALKPGLLLDPGRAHAGLVRLDQIGLDARSARIFEVEDADVASRLPHRPREAHKWQSACYVVAGSPGMTGAAAMCARAAGRAGAGMIRLGSPGAEPGAVRFPEAVARPLPATDWAKAVLEEVARCKAVVCGPGLGPDAGASVRELVATCEVPMVLDADGLNALGEIRANDGPLARRRAPVILTPHAAEFARLAGSPPGEDRIASVRDLARRAGAVVLLKGSTTVVADPDGRVLIAASGSPRLATAGTGDVLSGVIGAFVARGLAPLEAAALGAHVHGRAAALGRSDGLLANDLPELVADVLSVAMPVVSRRAHPLPPSLAGD